MNGYGVSLTKLYHSPLFEDIRKYFEHCDSDHTIFLFVPYIKTNVLEKLLDAIPNKVVIVTTWKPKDIQFGSSEVALYPFCKERNIALYVNENLHLKVYSVGLCSGMIATGNISHRGLLPDGNYEAATMLEQFTVEDRLFFEKIRTESRLVDDTMYEELKQWSEENKLDVPELVPLQDIISAPKENDFLISALPMTESVDKLIAGYVRISKGENPSDDSVVSACIFHDLVNYGISSGLGTERFIEELTRKFFEHPFIQKIDEFIAPKAHFGSIKVWIHNNCTTVPVPSRRELTGNVKVLLEWFEKLGNGRYVIDVPGAHSQRIRKIKQ